MTSKKEKAAPESAAETEAPDEADIPLELSVEDLIPGLEEEIAAQEPEEETPEQRILALESERDSMADKWKRALAEAENVRRRAERDRKDAEAYGGTRLARDLLNVYDNLERALQAADDDLRESAKSFIEGVELTQRELLNAFAKHKIEKVTPEIGDRFDPNRHQAMFEVALPGAEAGAIIDKMQDGFMIADRLLRPALVGVAKAEDPAKDNAPDEADEPETSEETEENET